MVETNVTAKEAAFEAPLTQLMSLMPNGAYMLTSRAGGNQITAAYEQLDSPASTARLWNRIEAPTR